mmetsp:Transcript_57276/g.161773  ORF Transcript_57276/g.161773 Transcript_57276/m.161773 type:complete len:275 (+) Transcript_57276:978-1802(+)
MRFASVPSAGDTHSKGGGGFPRQRFERVHVAFRSIDVFSDSRNTAMIGYSPPLCSTRSRKFGESPAMFPRAQTACSRTSSLGDPRSITKIGRAPCSTTTRVCSAVPDAMFVSTQAASNCRSGRFISFRNSTKRGTMPVPMTSWIGGFCSMLKSFRNCCVVLNCTCGSSVISIWLRDWICSMGAAGAPPAGTVCIAWPPWAAADDGSPTMGPGAAPGSSSLPIRLFHRACSPFDLRSCTMASSRFRRASSTLKPFLNPFCRWFRISPKPDIFHSP